ncbi:MAG: Glu/Leu/Phe/Val dehydrogenase dimerization domain-containing protein, partial [Deltaproteobacteria bacterium]
MHKAVESFMADLIARNPSEPQFHQAVREVVESVMPIVETTPAYRQAKILERMVEPERTIMFRVPWVDDKGQVQVNKGFRVQLNSAIGPFKGGLRYHPAYQFPFKGLLRVERLASKDHVHHHGARQAGAGFGGCMVAFVE